MESARGYKEVEINKVRLGDFIVNLGKVLEIDELPELFSFVISRREKKEVFEFGKATILLIESL